MKFHHHFVLALLALAVSSPKIAHAVELDIDVFLQVQEIGLPEPEAGGDSDNGEIIRSIETHAIPGKGFYVREVRSGEQMLLKGSIEREDDYLFTINYFLDFRKLGNVIDGISGQQTLKGTATLKPWESTDLAIPDINDDSTEQRPRVKYVLSIFPFQPSYGYVDVSSRISLRLIDETSEPVQDAVVIVYDSDRLGRMGKRSNADGLVSFSELREELPILTIVAEQSERDLVAIFRPDRNYNAQHPSTIIMKKRPEDWDRRAAKVRRDPDLDPEP